MSKKSENFKYLVIVESPAKSKTLTKILGSEFLVKSSIGHIRDLPNKGLGIDVKKNFEPEYEIMPGKKKVVDELNDFAKQAERIYLASDPDREGEAIAWHLAQILKTKGASVHRVAFNQITPQAVKAAVANPREIDTALVNAQQARRILDRLVGFKISPILWRTIGGRSAGRVQSVAVRLICEREEEIRNFVPEEYWSIAAEVLAKGDSKDKSFTVKLVQLDDKRIVSPLKESNSEKTTIIRSESEVKQIIERIQSSSFSVTDLSSRASIKKASAPFKTSTLQRAASSAFGYTVKRTMQIAQTLYEGVKLGKTSDPVGLITYMRTDSLRIAPEAQEAAKEFILNKWGEDYYPSSPNIYGKTKGANEQDAHEAIRPTYAEKTPESVKGYLSEEQYKLYKLIWERFICSQMSPMKLDTLSLEISSEPKDLVFRASQSKKTFPGYSVVYGNSKEINEDFDASEEESKFPTDIKTSTPINILETNPSQHFTEGPPRYNEASLVKVLEELGIGRPSTYAPTIATILDRKYVEKLNNGNALIPTKLGISVNKLLVEHFGKYINVGFTSGMETHLDEIAESGLDWVTMLSEFYYGKDWKAKSKNKFKSEAGQDEGFIDIVKKAGTEIVNEVIETEHDCPTCGAKMNLKSSRFGPFLGCSKYPECKTIINLTKEGTPAPEDRPYQEDCPECKQHSLVIRYGRYGDYIACSTENCKYTSPIQKKTGIKCPREGCHGDIVEKKSRFGKIFFGCNTWSTTKCDVVFWNLPIQEHCPSCSKLLTYKSLKRGDKIACPDLKGCGYSRDASPTEIETYRPQISSTTNTANKSVFSLDPA